MNIYDTLLAGVGVSIAGALLIHPALALPAIPLMAIGMFGPVSPIDESIDEKLTESA